MLQSKVAVLTEPKECDEQRITIGRRETYGTQQVIFDCTDVSKVFDGLENINRVSLLLRLPNGETRSTTLDLDRNQSTLSWNVSTEDTKCKGNAECELFFYFENGGLWKSNIFKVIIKPDIG